MDLIDRERLIKRMNGQHAGWYDLAMVTATIEDEDSIDPLTDLLQWIDRENPQSVKAIVYKIKQMLRQDKCIRR